MNTIIEKIRAEVNKLPEEYKGLYKQFGNSLGFIDGLDMVKKILSDLEEAAKAYADDTNPTDSFYEAFKEGALWMREQMMKELSEKIASAYQLGLADKEKQMMKEAVEGIAVINANAKEDGFGYVRSDYVSDDVIRGFGRFKLIIVKED